VTTRAGEEHQVAPLRPLDDHGRNDRHEQAGERIASGIGAHVVRQLTELGAHVVGLDKQTPSEDIAEFYTVDLTDPASIDTAVSTANASSRAAGQMP